MKSFLLNLAFLIGIGIVLFLIAPDMMRQVFELFNGLGILGIFIVMVLIAALPRSSRSRRRRR